PLPAPTSPVDRRRRRAPTPVYERGRTLADPALGRAGRRPGGARHPAARSRVDHRLRDPSAAMNTQQLADTQQAFDAVAAEYDGPLGNNALVQGLRLRTLKAVLRAVPPGAALLDLGCGTGIDAVWLGQRPGGARIGSVIGRVCPWELAVCLRRGQWARARVRWSKRTVAVPLAGHTVWTRYYTPAEFRSAFEPAGFRLRSLRALGLFVPPPYLFAFAQRHPRALAALETLE